MRVKSFIQRHPVASYFVLAFAIAWSGILYVVGPQGIPGESDHVAQLLPMVFLAMIAGPSIASLLLTALVDGRAGLRDLLARQCRWRVHLRWYGIALLTTPLLLLLSLGVLAMWVSPTFMPGILVKQDKLSLFIYALVGGLGAGFFEELGWTGFATHKMQLAHRDIWSTLGLGALWMTWHLLADFWGSREFESFYLLHVLLWYLALIGYRVLMTWVYSHTQSLLVGQLMHAGFTGGQALLGPIALAAAEKILWYGIFVVALWIVVAIVIVATRARPTVQRIAPGLTTQLR
jgi:uncharacterized protein